MSSPYLSASSPERTSARGGWLISSGGENNAFRDTPCFAPRVNIESRQMFSFMRRSTSSHMKYNPTEKTPGL